MIARIFYHRRLSPVLSTIDLLSLHVEEIERLVVSRVSSTFFFFFPFFLREENSRYFILLQFYFEYSLYLS